MFQVDISPAAASRSSSINSPLMRSTASRRGRPAGSLRDNEMHAMRGIVKTRRPLVHSPSTRPWKQMYGNLLGCMPQTCPQYLRRRSRTFWITSMLMPSQISHRHSVAGTDDNDDDDDDETWPSVLSLLIFMPIIVHSCAVLSTVTAISSANRRLLILNSLTTTPISSSALANTLLRIRQTNNVGDRTSYNCLEPVDQLSIDAERTKSTLVERSNNLTILSGSPRWRISFQKPSLHTLSKVKVNVAYEQLLV